MQKKIQLRNIRIAYQTPLGIFDTAEEAERALARCDFDISLITCVRIGDKDDMTLGKSKWNEPLGRWITIGSYPIVISALADDQGFEAQI